MSWSLSLGTWAGVEVKLHFTFVLFLLFIGFSSYLQSRSLTDAANGVVFLSAVFLVVLLHEFGHALMARRFQISTRDITLYPFGGVARLERVPEVPIHELWVAAAGPAVNFILAGALAVWILFFQMEWSGSLIASLLGINLTLGLFNLIPAFPMDGGRVMRALLAMRMEYTQATQVAASTGQAFAILFGLIGLFTNPVLIFIALFVWIAASQENNSIQMKGLLGGIPVAKAMITDFRTLHPADTLSRAAQTVLSGYQEDFPVLEEERIVGILTRTSLLAALANHGEHELVSRVMETGYQSASPQDLLETVFAHLQACNCHTLPVLDRGKLVGMITSDNIGEWIMIRSSKTAYQRR